MGLINRRFPFPKFREMETPAPAEVIKPLQSQEMETSGRSFHPPGYEVIGVFDRL